MRDHLQPDWHRIFEDFAYLGVTGDELAEKIGLCRTLLQCVATGKLQPTPGSFDRIANLWCHLTGKPVEFLPRTADPIGMPRPQVAGLDRNVYHEPAYVQREALALTWAQVLRGAGKRR